MTTAAQAHAAMRDLPFTDVNAITLGRPIMVLAPHPDDEVLGCAGLIMQSLGDGLAPSVTIVTDGSGSHPNSVRFPPSVMRSIRAAEARHAAGRLGLPLCHLHFLCCRDTAAPHDGPAFERAIERIGVLAVTAGCGVICAPWRFDPHCDHLAAHKMAAEVAHRYGLRHLSYPVWGWTLPDDEELGPLEISGFRLRIAPWLDRKYAALQAYESQLGIVVDDDPTGFQLTLPVLDKLMQPFEVFLNNP